MPTHLPERRTAPTGQPASIVFLVATLAVLLIACFLSIIVLGRLGQSFGPDGNNEQERSD